MLSIDGSPIASVGLDVEVRPLLWDRPKTSNVVQTAFMKMFYKAGAAFQLPALKGSLRVKYMQDLRNRRCLPYVRNLDS